MDTTQTFSRVEVENTILGFIHNQTARLRMERRGLTLISEQVLHHWTDHGRPDMYVMLSSMSLILCLL